MVRKLGVIRTRWATRIGKISKLLQRTQVSISGIRGRLVCVQTICLDLGRGGVRLFRSLGQLGVRRHATLSLVSRLRILLLLLRDVLLFPYSNLRRGLLLALPLCGPRAPYPRQPRAGVDRVGEVVQGAFHSVDPCVLVGVAKAGFFLEHMTEELAQVGNALDGEGFV